MPSDRLAAVESLIAFSVPLELAAQHLQPFGWDYEGVPVELNSGHLVRVLQRYLQGELSARDVEDWANLIEGREDIEFSQACAGRIGEALHELANPSLFAPLDPARAEELIADIPA